MGNFTINFKYSLQPVSANNGKPGIKAAVVNGFPVARFFLIGILSFMFIISTITILYAQVGSVISYQKISDTQGNFTGTLNNTDSYGHSAANIGDLDGDGVSDLAIGANQDKDGGIIKGAVWILFMNTDGTVKSHQKISQLSGNFTGTFNIGEKFGSSIAALGDLDNDGVEDIAVGARGDDDGGHSRGAVWVLFLNTNGTVKSHQKISALQGGFTGSLDDDDEFGSSISIIGDMDDDGVNDIVAGAWKDDDGSVGNNDRGAIWIICLNSNGTVKTNQKISASAGNFTGSLNTGDMFGTSVAGINDLDGDGIPDIAVGAIMDDDGGPNSNKGAIWILFMNGNGTVKSHRKISQTAGGFTGVLDDEVFFGYALCQAGDINGDGITDIAIGGVNDDDGGQNIGAIWIIFLNTDGTVRFHQKISVTEGNFTGTLLAGDYFGSSIALLDDMDGDGNQDIIVGSRTDDDGGINRGAAWVLFLEGVSEQVSTTSGPWNDPASWTCNCVPSDTEKITIANGTTITLNGDITIKDIIIESGAILDADIINDYNITLKGNWENSGTFIQRRGEVNFESMVAQIIDGVTSFYNLTINNPNGVRIGSGTQGVQGTLTLTKGTLNVDGQTFIIISEPDETARIAGSGTGTIIGNITAQQYISGAPGFRFISSPVTGATLNEINDNITTWGIPGSDFPNYGWESIYYYDETLIGSNDTGWIPPSNMTELMIPGQGYIAYFDTMDLPVTLDIIGTANLGIYQPAITYNSTLSGIEHDGWNLIGNPYSSPIDWDAVNGWTRTNLDNAIYIFMASEGIYASYVNGIGINGGSKIIPATQAYWVKANNTGPIIGLTREATVDSDVGFAMENTTVTNAIRLAIGGNGYIDETVLYFASGASEVFDPRLDAYKLFSDNALVPQIFTEENNVKLSINSLPKLNEDIIVPLSFEIAAAGTYTIDAEELGIFQPSVCIYLEDILTGDMVDLKSGNSYSFFTDTINSSDPPRIFVHFSAPISINAVNVSCEGKNDGSARITKQSKTLWSCEVYNENGDKVHSSNNISGYEMVGGLPPGTYSVNIINGAFCSGAETFTIYEPDKMETFVNMTDASCYGETDAMIRLEVVGGIQPYSFKWNDGDTSQDLSQIHAGTYTVQIIDANACEYIEDIIVEEPAEIIAKFTPSEDIVYLKNGGLARFINQADGADYFEWDFGDGSPVSNLVEPTHSYYVEGEYTVTMIAYNGQCSDTNSMKVSVLVEPEEANLEESALVFPNPANKGSVQIVFPGSGYEEMTLEIFNSIGELIYSDNLKSENGQFTGTIETGQLSKGIYMIVGSNNGNNLFKRKLIIAN